ncbi:MAG: hypothetical protein ABI609_02305 [Acidobacteriota bacterium]
MNPSLRRFAAAVPLVTAAGVAMILTVLTACGAKGPVLPPVSYAPKPTTDLAVRQQGGELVLRASYPKTTISGVSVPGLDSVEIYRYLRPAPGTAKPEPPDPREFALAAEKTLVLKGAELTSAVTGDKLEFRLAFPQPLPADRQSWTLGIRLVAKGGDRSAFSNAVTLAPVAPPSPPTGLQVTAKENGIEVSWTAVPEPLIGCLIYRREAQSPGWGEFLHGTRIAEGASYLDTTAQYGHRYVYSLSAAASLDPRIESALAGEQEVDYQDRFAPLPPVHLLALAEARRVRLVWERSPALDVAGYVVFRQDPGGEFHRLNTEPVATLDFNDSGLVPRVEYRYRVAAIDKAGNLGEAGDTVTGSPSGQN